jgi:hypothetical protein
VYLISILYSLLLAINLSLENFEQCNSFGWTDSFLFFCEDGSLKHVEQELRQGHGWPSCAGSSEGEDLIE